MTNSNEDAKLETADNRCGYRGKFWRFPLIVAAVILIKAGIVLLLWNALIPHLFHGQVLTYLQALGLTVLAKLLLGFLDSDISLVDMAGLHGKRDGLGCRQKSARNFARIFGRSLGRNLQRRNPLSPVSRSHRRPSHNGGGLWRKKWLLDHERRYAPK
jgi:hypothetical protein